MPYLASDDARYDIGVPYFSVSSNGQMAPSSKDTFSVLANSKPPMRILIAVLAINEQAVACDSRKDTRMPFRIWPLCMRLMLTCYMYQLFLQPYCFSWSLLCISQTVKRGRSRRDLGRARAASPHPPGVHSQISRHARSNSGVHWEFRRRRWRTQTHQKSKHWVFT